MLEVHHHLLFLLGQLLIDFYDKAHELYAHLSASKQHHPANKHPNY